MSNISKLPKVKQKEPLKIKVTAEALFKHLDWKQFCSMMNIEHDATIPLTEEQAFSMGFMRYE